MYRLYAQVDTKIETEDLPQRVSGRSLTFLDHLYHQIVSELSEQGVDVGSERDSNLRLEVEGSASEGCIEYEALFIFAAKTISNFAIVSGLVANQGYFQNVSKRSGNAVHPQNTGIVTTVKFFAQHTDEDNVTALHDEHFPKPHQNQIVKYLKAVPLGAILMAAAFAILALGDWAEFSQSKRSQQEIIEAIAASSNELPAPMQTSNISFQCVESTPTSTPIAPSIPSVDSAYSVETSGSTKIIRINPSQK
ncbi:MAG: hypothetical protein KDA53_07535 [Hyphomonas sp.]|nr:hypothetical protein [Hyphomonas sp.]